MIDYTVPILMEEKKSMLVLRNWYVLLYRYD